MEKPFLKVRLRVVHLEAQISNLTHRYNAIQKLGGRHRKGLEPLTSVLNVKDMGLSMYLPMLELHSSGCQILEILPLANFMVKLPKIAAKNATWPPRPPPLKTSGILNFIVSL